MDPLPEYDSIMKMVSFLAMLLPLVTQAQPFASRECQASEITKPIAQVRRESGSSLYGLDDAQVVAAIHMANYPDLDVQTVACAMGVKLPSKPPPPKKLGMIDQWRYDSCRTDAAKAPTERGVTVAINICREKFSQ